LVTVRFDACRAAAAAAGGECHQRADLAAAAAEISSAPPQHTWYTPSRSVKSFASCCSAFTFLDLR
jgi:hypothetical protein